MGILRRCLCLSAVSPWLPPDLVFAETANVVWKKLRRGELTLQQANQTCEALPEFFTRVAPTASLIQDALRLAWRLDHPVYDCLCLACAEREGAKLVTADQQFARLLRASGMDRLVLSLEEISSSANAKLD